MHLLFFFAFTLIELAVVVAIIAILLIAFGPTIAGVFKSSRCQKLIAEIEKDLTTAKETAEKLYKGESTVTDANLNSQLTTVTNKLAKVDEACGDGAKNYSAVLSQINELTAQLKQYNQSDIIPEEKSLLDKFIGLLDAAAKKFTK
jgi:prepilin-type N-terminal cleavage/methylation domain-containing protein